MLPLILSISLMAPAVDMQPPPSTPKSYEEKLSDFRKYHTSTIVGLCFLFGGVLLLERDYKFGGGLAIGAGTPLAGMGVLGTFEVYEW